MGSLRAGSILGGFIGLTLPLMPVQALLVNISPRLARRFPHWYHRQVCRLIGVRLSIEGQVVRDRPVLIVANHTSWLDIPVLSAVAPVSFVAKREVGQWPFVSSLARLQRTVFVDRERRASAGGAADEILGRLDRGDAIVLFAEGTSSDGNRVLPFKTALFAAVKPPNSEGNIRKDIAVQTVSLVYTHLHGVPLGRADRPLVGWYGGMDMQSHAWALLKSGPLDARIRIGPPVPLEDYADRKALARFSEIAVREGVVGILRARSAGEPLLTTEPHDELKAASRKRLAGAGGGTFR